MLLRTRFPVQVNGVFAICFLRKAKILVAVCLWHCLLSISRCPVCSHTNRQRCLYWLLHVHAMSNQHRHYRSPHYCATDRHLVYSCTGFSRYVFEKSNKILVALCLWHCLLPISRSPVCSHTNRQCCLYWHHVHAMSNQQSALSVALQMQPIDFSCVHARDSWRWRMKRMCSREHFGPTTLHQRCNSKLTRLIGFWFFEWINSSMSSWSHHSLHWKLYMDSMCAVRTLGRIRNPRWDCENILRVSTSIN